MKSSLDELKAQSSQSFSFVSRTKESLSDVQELRETVTKSLKEIEPLLNDQGPAFKATEMRNIVSEFELECANCKHIVIPLYPYRKNTWMRTNVQRNKLPISFATNYNQRVTTWLTQGIGS